MLKYCVSPPPCVMCLSGEHHRPCSLLCKPDLTASTPAPDYPVIGKKYQLQMSDMIKTQQSRQVEGGAPAVPITSFPLKKAHIQQNHSGVFGKGVCCIILCSSCLIIYFSKQTRINQGRKICICSVFQCPLAHWPAHQFFLARKVLTSFPQTAHGKETMANSSEAENN